MIGSLGNALSLARHPLAFLERLQREQGDVARFRVVRQPIVLVSHPDLIRDVLVTHARRFHKGRGLERAKLLLGEGLLTSEETLHARQRRLVQPAFHRARIDAFGETMTRYAQRAADRWRHGQEIDLSREMAAYTLAVVGKTLFDADVECDARAVGEALAAAMAAFNVTVLPFGELFLRLPLPAVRRFRRGRQRLDALIYRLIRDRRAAGDDRGDLLSMLLLAKEDGADEARMTDIQLRDELMTLLLAGHETTANALVWTFYLLSQHPDVEARLHAELDAIGDLVPGAGDLHRLPYARAVLAEAFRLFPPAYIVGRRALDEYPLGDGVIAPRTIVLMSQWIVHRDPRWWPDATAFQPERWLPGGSAHDAGRPKLSYFPFGAGPRMCIGEQFAWMEGVLALASIARRWRLRLIPGHRVEPQPIITLRAKHGMRMLVEQR
jgi:cytochrome P450